MVFQEMPHPYQKYFLKKKLAKQHAYARNFC